MKIQKNAFWLSKNISPSQLALIFIKLQTKKAWKRKTSGQKWRKNNMLSTYVNMVIHEHLLDLLKFLNIKIHDYPFYITFCTCILLWQEKYITQNWKEQPSQLDYKMTFFYWDLRFFSSRQGCKAICLWKSYFFKCQCHASYSKRTIKRNMSYTPYPSCYEKEQGHLPSWKAEVVLCLPMERRVDEPKAFYPLLFFYYPFVCYSVSMFIISSQCSALTALNTGERY